MKYLKRLFLLLLSLLPICLPELNARPFDSPPDTLCGCINCPALIPDNSSQEFTFYVGSADNNDLASPTQGVCGVHVRFDHEYLGDLTMILKSPGGQTVRLVGPEGFFGATDFTSWDVHFTPCNKAAYPDSGFSKFWDNSQPWGLYGVYTGTYYPSFGCLEDFNMGTVTGAWTLKITDGQAIDAGNLYDFSVDFCDTTGLHCQACIAPPIAQLNATPAGFWDVSLQNVSHGSPTHFDIDFGDSQMYSGPSIPFQHTYEDAGVYTIRLIASNECGADTVWVPVSIIGDTLFANVSLVPNTGCAPLTVQTQVLSSNAVDQWHWIFPGGLPAESYDLEPTVIYPSPGNFEAMLVISHGSLNDTIGIQPSVHVLQSLVAPAILIQADGPNLICTNTTLDYDYFYWTLNGGAPTGQNTNPIIFKVDSTGVYHIGLYVANSCSYAFVEDSVSVFISSVASLDQRGYQIQLSPNPSDGYLKLRVDVPAFVTGNVSVYNALGEELFSTPCTLNKGQNVIPLQLQRLPRGRYLLRVQTSEGVGYRVFVIGE